MASAGAAEGKRRVLLIGITGISGRSALEGLLAQQGDATSSLTLTALTRNPQGQASQAIKNNLGVELVEGDLDNEQAVRSVLHGVDVVYCHALSKDAAVADKAEIPRAKRLAVAAADAKVKLIVYNSSGGKGCGYGITQMEQKHAIEDIFTASGVPLVALQAPMFMEEWWKRYTRPSILKGKFPLSLPSDRPVQLLAARDMGTVLARVLRDPPSFAGRSLQLAGDELTPLQMCEAFSRVQGRPVAHSRPPAFIFWFLARDVYRICKFLAQRGFGADVAACRQQFPGLLDFETFLRRSNWADESRTYEQGITCNTSGAHAAASQPAPQ